MGFFKKIGKGLKKVGRKLKRGVKKLGQNLKKYGPKLLQIGSMFIPGGGLLSGALGKLGGGMLGKLGGGMLGKAFSGGGFLGKVGGWASKLGKGGGLFGKAGGFMSGQGKLSQMFGGGGMFGKIKDWGKGSFLDPSGDGLWGGGQLMDKFGGGQEGGMGGLLSTALGGAGAMYSPDLNYDIQAIRDQYGASSAKANQLEKYYRDMGDPDSAMNQKIAAKFGKQSMDQAAMAELAGERRMGGATSGMQNEALSEIYDNASEQGGQNFANYMLGQTGRAGQGLASTLPYWQQIDNEAASAQLANQQHGFQQAYDKAGAINQIGGGLLDYGMGQLFPQQY